MTSFTKLCLSAFQLSLQQTLPSECVKRSLQILRRHDRIFVLIVNNREYLLNHNVHIVGIGKAAYGMVAGAEEVLSDHLVDGIAAAPIDSIGNWKLRTQFYRGAANNLPDKNALEASRKIVEFVKSVCQNDNQIILFLISGGGSALLPSPIDGLTLDEKLDVIQTLTQNGANIKELNIVRSALSLVKGGKLARLGVPAKMIGLIMSDIVGDPISLISSGPTVPQYLNPKEAIEIFQKLNVIEKIPSKVVQLLNRLEAEDSTDVDVNNVIIANNRLFLETFAKCLRQNAAIGDVIVVTSTLEGDATEIGAKFADLIRIIDESPNNLNATLSQFQQNNDIPPPKLSSTLESPKRIVYLFGGETTVRFLSQSIASTAKGGRNQELVLAALKRLREESSFLSNSKINFALFSLGTDGQDGPTNAAGAYITRDDVMHMTSAHTELLNEYLVGKKSYEFWATKWRDGNNLVKLGKTGTNLMDVQILFVAIK